MIGIGNYIYQNALVSYMAFALSFNVIYMFG